MAELSLETATIEDKKCILIFGKCVFELVELTVGNIDSGGDVALNVFWFIGPRINNRDIVRLGYFYMLLDEIHRSNVMKLPRRLCLSLSWFAGGLGPNPSKTQGKR